MPLEEVIVKSLVLLLAALPAFAAEEAPKPMAVCVAGRGFGADLRAEFRESSPGKTEAKVTLFNRERERAETVTVTADFRLKTWITYEAKFEALGKSYILEFSNYQSPSLGELNIDRGPTETIACTLEGV